MAISFQADNVKLPVIKKREISKWIKTVALKYGKTTDEISYIFCDDEKILEINKEYLKHDYYTDIITFDYSEGEKISGDIFISIDTVKSNSQMYTTDYQDELYRVIIHGVLHLCGLDDSSEAEQKIMREAEDNALKLLKHND
ncbi:MAG: rRNA maturation RNase YbeY [Fermentimonas sp.]|jgi:rRNA maturation RNase YbeY|nr:rRNA maturation RNase YbeY [Fermentimonas sp.]NLC86422.1 rRNA maturation RNase YbeY [Bacteroidales bacterium]HBT86373.1 rRNA maturation RNase YbeY [Porphyromonadaceae bacterium]MDD2930990.1 rRNA maturation RNase YbeY [Fermentimonas sp.]MDD3188792.1 rRNA maturation RNase YbeY [Fermentimonas sp.]